MSFWDSSDDTVDTAERYDLRAPVIVWVLIAAPFVLTIWGVFAPPPWRVDVILTALIPPLAIYVAAGAPGTYRFGPDRRRGTAPSLFWPTLMAALGLFVPLQFYTVPGWTNTVPFAAFVGIALAWLAGLASSDLRGSLGRGLAVLALYTLYAGSVILQADILLDRGPVQHYTAQVVDKSVSGGRSTSYRVRLAPWGPVGTTETSRVTARLYGATTIGGYLCPALGTGALGLSWYRVEGCGIV